MKDEILILRAQANRAVHNASRLQKLAGRWIEDVWHHEELRITLSSPSEPVAARRHAEYMNTRPADRYDVPVKDVMYSDISCHVWAEIERQVIAGIFEQAAFYDGSGGPRDRVRRLQEVVAAAIADGTACALEEGGWVPDVPNDDDDGV
jgi:hypothetical protein